MAIEFKSFDFDMKVKALHDDDDEFGFISGHAAAFTTDRGGDRIERGAFLSTIKEHQDRNRKIRMKFQHSDLDLIGGFDPFRMSEDEKGLLIGEDGGAINMQVQRGREARALAKQRVLIEMSIGFIIREAEADGEIRVIKDLELLEISLVGEPMNRDAQITQVKNRGEVLTISQLKEILNTKKRSDLEKILRDGGQLSKSAVEFIVAELYKRETHAEPVRVDEQMQSANKILEDELLKALEIIKSIRK